MAAFRPSLLAVVLLVLTAGACDAEYFGRRVGRVATTMRALQVVGSAGDINSSGAVGLTLFKHGEIYNIRYTVHVWQVSNHDLPTKATVNHGMRFTNGPAVIEFTGEWRNMTSNYQRPKHPKMYTYVIAGVWRDAATLEGVNGESLVVTMKAILAHPRQFYGLVTTPSHPEGAVRGQIYRTQ